MSQIDLFGNPSPSSKASKKFKLTLSSTANTKDKKQKTRIYALAKEVEEQKEKIKKQEEQIDLTKACFKDVLGNTVRKTEQSTIDLIEHCLFYLKPNKGLKSWQMELLLRMVLSKIKTYSTSGLNMDLLTELKYEIYAVLETRGSNRTHHSGTLEPLHHSFSSFLDVEYEEFESSSEDIIVEQETINEDHPSKFKKLYKTLIKQIHPDVMFYSSEENNNQVQELNTTWKHKNYYQLLQLNHKINPDSIIELSTDELNRIEEQLEVELIRLQEELNNILTSFDYSFYIDRFYNTSETVIKSRVLEFKHFIDNYRENNISFTGNYLQSAERLTEYLHQNRTRLSEALDIKYLIEDLYGIDP